MHERPYRKRLRYQGHDYRAPCTVHVTICTYSRQHLFGTVTPEGMRLNDTGHFVDSTLRSCHSDAEGIAIDTHIVMPDHLHAIIMLGTNPRVETTASIPDIVQRFKMKVMKSWPGGVRTRGWSPYDTHLWHRSYYDTLIENDRHLAHTRQYILANPARWIERASPSAS
jgi:putative transposase